MIHGGNPVSSGIWAKLRPTHDCIIVSNSDRNTLADLVSAYSGTGYIGIYGTQKERP